MRDYYVPGALMYCDTIRRAFMVVLLRQVEPNWFWEARGEDGVVYTVWDTDCYPVFEGQQIRVI